MALAVYFWLREQWQDERPVSQLPLASTEPADSLQTCTWSSASAVGRDVKLIATSTISMADLPGAYADSSTSRRRSRVPMPH
jgi:hypothetical protein